MSATTSDSLSFDAHIKPMFREGDRVAMQYVFDLWSYEDVTAHADAILAAVAAGKMPCDSAWPRAQVDRLRRWIDSGTPR